MQHTFLHGVRAVALGPVEVKQHSDGSPYAVRDVIITRSGREEIRLSLFADGVDAPAALALSGPELDALCAPPAPCRTCGCPDPYPALPSAPGWDRAPGR